MTTATAPLNLPAAVVRLIREGAAELESIRLEQVKMKDAQDQARNAKENAAFLELVNVVTDCIEEPIIPFIDFDRAGFDMQEGSHVVYVVLDGLTRIAIGFGSHWARDTANNREWSIGTAGFLVAEPQLYDSTDDGWSCFVPEVWPARQTQRSSPFWTAYSTLPQALAAARVQFGKIEGLQAEAAAKQLDREERAAARVKSNADRKAAKSRAELLTDALRELIDERINSLSPENLKE